MQKKLNFYIILIIANTLVVPGYWPFPFNVPYTLSAFIILEEIIRIWHGETNRQRLRVTRAPSGDAQQYVLFDIDQSTALHAVVAVANALFTFVFAHGAWVVAGHFIAQDHFFERQYRRAQIKIHYHKQFAQIVLFICDDIGKQGLLISFIRIMDF